MHISLTPELERLVKKKVETGFYNNASEVVREALRFMETHEEWVYQMKVDLLRRHLADAQKEIESGRGRRLEGPDQIHGFFEGLKKRSQKKRTG